MSTPANSNVPQKKNANVPTSVVAQYVRKDALQINKSPPLLLSKASDVIQRPVSQAKVLTDPVQKTSNRLSSAPTATTMKRTGSNPSVTSSQVGKAVAERTATLLQELSQVMRDTAMATSKQQFANLRSIEPARSQKTADMVTPNRIPKVNTVRLPAAKPSHGTHPGRSLKPVAEDASVRSSSGIVTSATPTLMTSLIPSVVSKSLQARNPLLVQGAVPVTPVTVSSGQAVQARTKTIAKAGDPSVSEVNSILRGIKDSSGTVIQTGSTTPTLVYAYSDAQIALPKSESHKKATESTPRSGRSNIPPAKQVYAIIPPVGGVQSTMYRNILPTPPTSAPLTLIQNISPAAICSLPNSGSNVQPTALLNAKPGTMLVTFVGDPNMGSVPSTLAGTNNQTSFIVNNIPSVESTKTNIKKSVDVTYIKNAQANGKNDSPVPKTQQSTKKLAVSGEAAVIQQTPAGAKNLHPSNVGSSDKDTFEVEEIPMESAEENEDILREEIKLIHKEKFESARSSLNKTLEILTAMKTDSETKSKENKKTSPKKGTSSMQRQEDKTVVQKKTIAETKPPPKGKLPSKAPENPKKQSDRDMIKKTLQKYRELYSELPPKKPYISFTADEFQNISHLINEAVQDAEYFAEDLKKMTDLSCSYLTIGEIDKNDHGGDTVSPRGRVLCRLCARFFKRESLIPLYSTERKGDDLIAMVNSILPGVVGELDGLPQQVCKSCAQKLVGCYQIAEDFRRADRRLRTVLSIHTKSKEGTPSSVEEHKSSLNGEMQSSSEKPLRKRTRIPSENRPMPSEPEANHESKRRCVSPEVCNDLPTAEEPPCDFVDYSLLDPEYNDGYEVEWCLDEETIRSTLVQVSPSQSKHDEEHSTVTRRSDSKSENRGNTEAAVESIPSLESSSATESQSTQLQTESDSTNTTTVNFSCSVCQMYFPSKQEAFLHKVMNHDNELMTVLKPNHPRRGNSAVQPDKHQVEVSGQNKNREISIDCDQCELSFLNEYSYFIHKCVVHDFIMDSKSLAKYRSEGEGKKKVSDSGTTSEKSAKGRNNSASNTVSLKDGVFLPCGSGMLWVDSSKLQSKVVGVNGKSGSKDQSQSKTELSKGSALSSKTMEREEEEEGVLLRCNVCDLNFSDTTRFSVHMLEHEKSYKCNECNNVFVSVKALHDHIPSHIPADCICNTCGVLATSKKKLEQHKKEHTHPLPHNCQICGKRFPNEQTLKVHKAVHFGRAGPLVCQICKKHFYYRRNFVCHLLSHAPEKPHKCSVCFRIFRSRVLLHKHLALHRLTKSFDCCVCQKLFTSWNGLVKHRYQKHLGTRNNLKNQYDTKEPNPLFQCNKCNKVLETKICFIKHLKSHKTTWPFFCFQCNRSFVSRVFLAQHLCFSRALLLCQCNICGKSFSRRAFKSHKLLHNYNKKHTCRFCGKTFRWYKSLYSHILVHGGDGFQCPCCSVSFKNKCALWRHHSLSRCPASAVGH